MNKVAFELKQSEAALALVRCPSPSQLFQGRQDILEKMDQYFLRDIGTRHTYILHGLGGSGKTQIALKFLDMTKQTSVYKTVFHQCQLSPNSLYGFQEYSHFSKNRETLGRCITVADVPEGGVDVTL
ncbi:hypothetical protein K438DRAFT_1838684 [Mycena galopus ATCC 62051]|nr:hypothetical protein K438DRAFT_1838684 [Mycena galopus ATCC 62051]